MALEFTYRITSDIPWADITENPDDDSNRVAGENLVAGGNHTVSEPVIIDDYTREWTLTFADLSAWETYKATVIEGTSDAPYANPGFTAFVISTPTQ